MENRQQHTTAYNLRSSSSETELESIGRLLTETSERVVKKLTLESLSLSDTIEYSPSNESNMPGNNQDSAMMICYRECLSNLEKFDGSEEKKIQQFLSNIERIGRMIDANDAVLHCMCTAKLDGEAKRWYENNMFLAQWGTLKSALLERFTQSDSSWKVFEQLKDRKQKPDETITSYCDDIIKMCREYDSTMSEKMMMSWMENGIKDALRIPIKRQLKLLSEAARTTQAFLKIAKDEQELQEHSKESDSTASYVPYFTNTVSTTIPQPSQPHESASATTYRSNREPMTTATHLPENPFQRQSAPHDFQQRTTQRPRTTYRYPPRSSDTASSRPFDGRTRKFKPCIICQRENHRMIDCNQKKPNGCFKCGQSDHRIRDCPSVFY